MRKQIWLTSLSTDRNAPSALAAKLGSYGFDVAGAIWKDDNERMGWQESQEMLLKPDVAGWLVLVAPEELAKPSVRYGLSLLALSVATARPALPAFLVVPGTAPAPTDTLPSPLASFYPLLFDDPSLCAKVVAKTSVPPKSRNNDYRLDIIGDQQVGQWFEVSPRQGFWKGALFGVSGGEINFHAVGPSGSLPKDTVLNYPVKGITLTIGDREYTAWGVANELPEGTSYLVRVTGAPEAVVFGPFPDNDDPELYTLRLT
jgi:hypothetical protein